MPAGRWLLKFYKTPLITSKLRNNLLLSYSTSVTPQKSTVLDNGTSKIHWQENVQKMCILIVEYSVFTTDTGANRGLVNAFTGKQATDS